MAQTPQMCAPVCPEGDRLAAIDEKLDRLIELQIGQAVLKTEMVNLTARVDSHSRRLDTLERQPLKLLGLIGGGVVTLAVGLILWIAKLAVPGGTP